MSLWRQLSHGLRNLLNRGSADREIADEAQHFLEQSVAAHEARGLSSADAQRLARMEMGSDAAVREQVRDYGWEHTVETLLSDVRYAARRLRSKPAFSAIVVATLALGIGGSTAMFSAVNPILLESLPYPDATRLVVIQDQVDDGSTIPTTFGTYTELSQRVTSFESLAASVEWLPTLNEFDRPERLAGQSVTAGYFRTLGVLPAIGRDFDPADDRPNVPNTVILSDRLWRQTFGGDTGIVGRGIMLNGRKLTVVGVMPPTFESVPGSPADIWRLLQLEVTPPEDPGSAWGHFLRVIARVRDDASIEKVRAELDGVARNPLPQFSRPAWAAMRRAPFVGSLHVDATRAVRPAFLALFGAVLLVLLIACVNVANLLLGRGLQQRAELAVRAALGAGTGRLVRQLLTETVMLALLGGVVGIALAYVAVQALVTLAPPDVPRLGAIVVNGPALQFALSMSTLVGLLIGLSPAIQASRADPIAGLQGANARISGGHRVTRRALVVTEVALALVLLVSAGLLLRSLNRVFAVDPGFEPAGLVTMQLQVSGQQYASDTAIFGFVARALQVVKREPGVDAAAFTSQLPLSGDAAEFGAQFEASETGNAEGSVIRYGVTPGYFETMGIPLVRGRFIEPTDRAGTPRVIVLNESFANRKFAGRDPIGQRVRLGPADGPWFTIVGVVGDVKQLSLAASQSDAAYMPSDQGWFADRALWLVARGAGDGSALAARLRSAIWSVDNSQAVVRVGTMENVVAESAAHRRFALLVFEAFAGVALVLAALGIYGVISGTVGERFREIGVRSALGATSRDIVSLVIRQGLALTGWGIIAGLPIAIGATKLIATLLYGVSRVDGFTYGAVVTLLLLVAGAASWIPASRAARVDPTIALKQ